MLASIGAIEKKIKLSLPDLKEEEKAAVEAVRLASLVCDSVQRALVLSQKKEGISQQKEDKSPVTVADYAAQAITMLHLLKHFPDCKMVGEEEAKGLKGGGKAEELRNQVVTHVQTVDPTTTEEQVLNAIDRGRHGGGPKGRFWVLDPIDGTKGFLRGEQYAVALGLIEDGEVILGVLGCPNLPQSWERREEKDTPRGVLFLGIKGRGAYSIPINRPEERNPIRVSPLDDITRAFYVESVEAGHSDQNDSVKIGNLLGLRGDVAVRMDSQAKYGVLARGDAPIYLRLPTRKGYVETIWDHAAGVAVIEAAGGRVTDVNGKSLNFSLGRGLTENEGVVATNGTLHEQVLRAVRSVLWGKELGAGAIADHKSQLLSGEIPIADPHMHFWSVPTHPWVEKSPFQKLYTPVQYADDCLGFRVVKCVNIQGDYWPYNNLGESQWLQSLADEHGYPHGIIGFADLSDPKVAEEHLKTQIRECKNFRGIRFMLDYHPTDEKKRQTSRGDWMKDESWIKSFALLSKYKLIFDLQLLVHQMEDAAAIAKKYPDVQIVLNHTGLPYGRTPEEFAAWKAGMTLLSACPNVAVKISGFGMTEEAFTVDSVRPYIETSIKLFGVPRIMFASNFPVDKKFSRFAKIWLTFEHVVDRMGVSEANKRALFHDNACRIYKL